MLKTHPVQTSSNRRSSRLPLVALVLAVVAVVLSACGSSASAVQTVDPAAFLTTAAQQGVTVIDVRTPAEYAAGHVDGAVNVDVESPDFAEQLATLDKAGTYAVYCHSGRRSAMATDQMAQAGFTTVYNLSGGIGDLQAAGAQIVTS